MPVRAGEPELRAERSALEDRLTPSTFTVTNLLDSGPGSLRSAIGQANLAGQGVVNFQRGLSGTITLANELPITSNLRIDASVATGGDEDPIMAQERCGPSDPLARGDRHGIRIGPGA